MYLYDLKMDNYFLNVKIKFLQCLILLCIIFLIYFPEEIKETFSIYTMSFFPIISIVYK